MTGAQRQLIEKFIAEEGYQLSDINHILHFIGHPRVASIEELEDRGASALLQRWVQHRPNKCAGENRKGQRCGRRKPAGQKYCNPCQKKLA